jgi:hypothetical protein
MRYTSKDVVQAFERLARTLGKSTTTIFDADPKDNPSGHSWTANVGSWRVDNYNGYLIEQIVNEALGVSRPFGNQRYTAREFVLACQLAEQAVRCARGEWEQ